MPFGVCRLGGGRFGYGTPKGERLAAPLTFPRKRDADQWLAGVEADLVPGTWIDDRLARVLVSECLFRNAPFPVVYALLIDSVPKAAGTAMGIMIGVALGVSGVFASIVAGSIIDSYGFTVHYIVLAAIVLLALIPLSRIRETVSVGIHDA